MSARYYGSMEEKPVDESSEGLLEDSLSVTEESQRVGTLLY